MLGFAALSPAYVATTVRLEHSFFGVFLLALLQTFRSPAPLPSCLT